MRWGHHGSDLSVRHIPQMFDWIEMWEFGSTLKTFCRALQTIPEQLVLCGRMHYPAERGQNHHGLHYVVHGFQHCLGRCQSNIYVTGRTQGFPAEHPIMHPGTRCSPSKRCTPGRPRDLKESMIQ